METVDSDKPRPVAPPEPISPALSSTAAPKPSTSRTASPTHAPTPDSTSTRAIAVEVKSPAVPDSAIAIATDPPAAVAPSPSEPRAATPTMPQSPLPSSAVVAAAAATATTTATASDSASVTKDHAPSPHMHSTSTVNGKSPVIAAAATARSPSPRHSNGRKVSIGDGDVESELSDPASTVHSPSGVDFNEFEDEIIVRARTNGTRKSSPPRPASDAEDETMTNGDEEHVTSHYPKRKRTSIFNDLSESKITADDRQASVATTRAKPSRSSTGTVKGVTVGYWRDSDAPTEELKHAVIGFIDVRERLRTRIQPVTRAGDTITDEYPLPPGPGGSWVTFERIVFLDHLVGLDHLQVKEYVRLRTKNIGTEKNQSEQTAGELEDVKEAIRRAKLIPTTENNSNPPQIAYGVELPEHLQSNRDAKRRRTSGGFAPANTVSSNGPVVEHTPIQPAPGGPQPLRNVVDPLPGTRPTRILLGTWAKSAEPNPKNRHAVYGILGQNDMFRVKLVRETRDGRFVDGNFPVGAGALWIPYEDVDFEKHLAPLARHEIKEYCRVRQWQLDHGETAEERPQNEIKAVFDAQARAAGTNYKAPAPLSIAPALPRLPGEFGEEQDQPQKSSWNGNETRQELRQSRRVEAARAEGRLTRQAPIDTDAAQSTPATRPITGRTQQSTNALERTSALAEREITRVEQAQERAHLQAVNRERAAAAAAQAAAAAAAKIPGMAINGRQQFHESHEMQRLNKVWASQESMRFSRASTDDAKMYGGVKYERKANGPFTGKLVSQGTIINIDGEDYVEYRVLTKPSFF
ncbi:hypothetical protein FLAG1_09674 [Fusarium langsethiae]|uniref:Uncharacterized protein n=1 Tax=Fusarium langsethiae TaxID=179993 RepID=A0A0N0DC00_FUSLA|nr:hypothetical protein FLAG1_09674 [Fusarium langsethiae]GKU06767.1 unnamed protein product [Fusarium langsethiae]